MTHSTIEVSILVFSQAQTAEARVQKSPVWLQIARPQFDNIPGSGRISE